MNKRNIFGLTIISFLSYYFTGAMIVVTGIALNSIAQYFYLSVSEVSNAFTFLNAGILISIFLNSTITTIFSFKEQIILGFFLIILAIIGFVKFHTILIFCTSMFIFGFVGGLTMSIGTFIITNIYQKAERTSKLLITDSFFSMAGIIFPVAASCLLNHHIFWYWIYIFIGLIYFIIFIITLNIEFPIYNVMHANHVIKNEKYKTSVFILCVSALFYILGQLGFISWIPAYAIQNIGMNIQSAGKLVSIFWLSYMIGMWFFSYVLRFFDLQYSLTILTGISTIFMYYFIHNTDILLLNILIAMLGFFSSAIYTVIITLTALQTKIPSQKLINFTLIAGTTGTLLTFIITGPIVYTIGIPGALKIANILYGLVFTLCILLGFTSNHKKNF
ncbi:MFS transporter TsgA [Buchnera aphidicola]|uniref:MFS transporter TsgA n=1 Tax=Buchnera aphidicola TaxID=9 RepID=UPI0031B873C7